MKKSFTLIELIIVIVILGILSTIAVEIIYKVYQNYYLSRVSNKLSYQTDLILNRIAAKLKLRIPNSTIAVECNVTNGDCENGNIQSFKSVELVSDSEAQNYPVLEWLEKDIYSKRGIYDSNKKLVIPGWAEFVDLVNTQTIAADEYQINMPYSNFDIVKEIDSNWTAQWGLNGDIFTNKYEVLIFSGPDSRGDFSDINNSYGYYGHNAYNVFQILNYSVDENKTVAHIKAIDISNSTMVYEQYFLVNTAMAIVPVYNSDTQDFNLTLRFNYFPWNDQNYTAGNSALLATHVTQFRFREQNGIMRIYICISDPKVKINSEALQICKEKVVF